MLNRKQTKYVNDAISELLDLVGDLLVNLDCEEQPASFTLSRVEIELGGLLDKIYSLKHYFED